MDNTTPKVRPFLLESELFKPPVPLSLATKTPRFGGCLEHQIFWTSGGGSMMSIRVGVLGTDDESFYCHPELFLKAAFSLGGEPIFSPPPFAVPCTDGLLIIYTLRHSRNDTHDIRGGYILLPKDMLERELLDQPISIAWNHAQKPMDMASMLKRLGFGETRVYLLN